MAPIEDKWLISVKESNKPVFTKAHRLQMKVWYIFEPNKTKEKQVTGTA